VNIALANAEVQKRLKPDNVETRMSYINYILPSDLYISEIPMKKIDGVDCDHFLQRDYSGSTFKIIFTKAEIRNNRSVEGKLILLNTLKRAPLLEVRIDIVQNRIIEIADPSTEMNYGNIPMPIF
jgi:hypothetical protein